MTMHLSRFVVCSLMCVWMTAAQTSGSSHAADAKREYAAVFAHPDNPCTWTDNASYLECMGKEIAFTEEHLDAFVAAMRAVAAGDDSSDLKARKEADEFNKTDLAWREYRKNACSLQFALFEGGTGGAPAMAECELSLDRDYMKLLAGFLNLHELA